jgi:hypothetical protein
MQRQLGTGGDVENAAPTERRVEQQAQDILAALLEFALQELIDDRRRVRQVRKEVTHARLHRLRQVVPVRFGNGLQRVPVEHIVEFVDATVESFQGITVFLARLTRGGAPGNRHGEKHDAHCATFTHGGVRAVHGGHRAVLVGSARYDMARTKTAF